MLKVTNDNFVIIRDEEESPFPYVIVPITGSLNTDRKKARTLLLEAGLKPFRFRGDLKPFKKFAEFGVIQECICFYFDFPNKTHRKSIRTVGVVTGC